MNLAKHPYYEKMLQKDRMIPFFKGNRLICFFTFYITDDETKYINSDAWEVLEDNPNGKICYISQLFTNKVYADRKLSYEVWHRFKKYIKSSFPTVEIISWRRWNKESETVKTYRKRIR